MDLVKKLYIFYVFLLGIIGQENVFYDILKREQGLLNYKNNELNKLKNWDFFKGLVHGFGQKVENFLSASFWQNRPGKCVWRYCRKKESLSRLSKQGVQKVEKLGFFQTGLVKLL